MPILLIIAALLVVLFVYPLFKRTDIKHRTLLVLVVILLGLAALFFLRGMAIPAFVMSIGAAIFAILRSIIMSMLYGRFVNFITGRIDIQTNKPTYPNTTNVSVAEALEIMELEDGYTEELLVKRYHELMKKNHPDQGGSKYIAKQINNAKEVLLNELEKAKTIPDDEE